LREQVLSPLHDERALLFRNSASIKINLGVLNMKFALLVLIVALTAGSVLGQSQTAPALRIVTDDPNLPSDLYYGDIKVKPLRLRPGTNEVITIKDSDFFIQQHYIDFLGRMPEPSGFAFWMNILNNCSDKNNNPNCDRIFVSSRFFMSDEFQERGFFVYKLYDGVLGRLAHFDEFMADVKRLNGTQTVAEQVKNKEAYVKDFVARAEFQAAYGQYTSADAFVNALCSKAGVTPASKSTIVQLATTDKALAVKAFIETPEVSAKFYDRGFIAMQYYGYLRREPEPAGFAFWQQKIVENNHDYRFMVGGFINSDEYRLRFGTLQDAQ
jgi:hypothetical protein